MTALLFLIRSQKKEDAKIEQIMGVGVVKSISIHFGAKNICCFIGSLYTCKHGEYSYR